MLPLPSILTCIVLYMGCISNPKYNILRVLVIEYIPGEYICRCNLASVVVKGKVIVGAYVSKNICVVGGGWGSG